MFEGILIILLFIGVGMRNTAIVFSGINGLDVESERRTVARIPEVSIKIKEAQKIIDQLPKKEGSADLDLMSSINSPNEVFLKNIKLKSLLSAVVQLGLYSRFRKSNVEPTYIVGNSNGDSALNVVTGRKSFKEMVFESQVVSDMIPEEFKGAAQSMGQNVVLSGITLTEYDFAVLDPSGVYKRELEKYMSFNELFDEMLNEYEVRRFVNIGPSNTLIDESMKNNSYVDIELSDVIEIDPMLAWYGSEVSAQENLLSVSTH